MNKVVPNLDRRETYEALSTLGVSCPCGSKLFLGQEIAIDINENWILAALAITSIFSGRQLIVCNVHEEDEHYYTVTPK